MMDSKFSPDTIFRDFCKYYESEKLMLIYVPLLVSGILSFFVIININLINILIASLSIFMGFLLNLMILSVNFKDNEKPPVEVGGRLWFLTDFLEEYHITISFELLITIILIIFLIFSVLMHKTLLIYLSDYIWILKYFFNFFVVFLISLFFIILFRVLKIGYRLMKYYIKN